MVTGPIPKNPNATSPNENTAGATISGTVVPGNRNPILAAGSGLDTSSSGPDPRQLWVSISAGLVLLLTAGMLNIPLELHDAARVDGVNEWQRFWYITIPLMAHTLVLVGVILAINTLQEYTSVVVLTQGGPGNATYVLNLLIVQEAMLGIGRFEDFHGTGWLGAVKSAC